jgi:hypothetical protein
MFFYFFHYIEILPTWLQSISVLVEQYISFKIVLWCYFIGIKTSAIKFGNGIFPSFYCTYLVLMLFGGKRIQETFLCLLFGVDFAKMLVVFEVKAGVSLPACSFPLRLVTPSYIWCSQL